MDLQSVGLTVGGKFADGEGEIQLDQLQMKIILSKKLIRYTTTYPLIDN